MRNDQPHVSIGMPVYNGERFLKEALDSVLGQTFEDFELIISDNASTDRTEKLCLEYSHLDPRIRYYRNHRNFGAARNFNRVFEEARGEYFKWVAADEGIEPGFLSRCLDVLDNDRDVVLACSKYIAYNDFAGEVAQRDYNFDIRSPDPCRRISTLLLETPNPVLPIWGLIRSSALRASYLIRPFVGSDICLVIQLLLKGGFAQVPEYLTRLRSHPDAYHAMLRDRPAGRRELLWFNPDAKGVIVAPHWRIMWESVRLSSDSSDGFLPLRMAAFLCFQLLPHWLRPLCAEVIANARLRPLYCVIRSQVSRALGRDGEQRQSGKDVFIV